MKPPRVDLFDDDDDDDDDVDNDDARRGKPTC